MSEVLDFLLLWISDRSVDFLSYVASGRLGWGSNLGRWWCVYAQEFFMWSIFFRRRKCERERGSAKLGANRSTSSGNAETLSAMKVRRHVHTGRGRGGVYSLSCMAVVVWDGARRVFTGQADIARTKRVPSAKRREVLGESHEG